MVEISNVPSRRRKGKREKFPHKVNPVNISVRNPRTYEDEEKKPLYTTYEIFVETTNRAFCLECSSIRRRFSEFDWLNKILKAHHPTLSPPSLPPKKFFKGRFDRDFIIFRMKGLEEYLLKVIQEKFYLSDMCLHLFLQTDLTIDEIDEYMEGRMPSHFVDDLWKCGGIKAMCSHFRQEATSSLPRVSSFVSDRDYASCTSDEDNGLQQSTDSNTSSTSRKRLSPRYDLPDFQASSDSLLAADTSDSSKDDRSKDLSMGATNFSQHPESNNVTITKSINGDIEHS